MRLLSCLLLAAGLACPAAADEFTAPAPVAAATVYPQGALLTRRAELDLPAGRHVVRLPAPADLASGAVPEIATSGGVEIAALIYRPDWPVAEDALFTAAQQAAQDRIDGLETEVEAAEDRLADARLQADALEAQRAYLAAIRPPAEDATDTEAARLTAEFVRAETERVLAELQRARRQQDDREEDLADLRDALAEAEAALARLSPAGETADMLELTVEMADAGRAAFELTETTDAAAWAIAYDMRLTTGDAPALDIDRKVTVRQWTGSYWSDVALTLSTSRPADRPDPVMPRPDRVSVHEPAPERERIGAAAPEPVVIEPELAMEDGPAGGVFRPEMVVDGVAVSYAYPEPVSVGTEDAALLFLGALNLPAETEIHASPRHDDRAYQVARFVNEGDAPILPGDARLYRDGHLVGRTAVGLIPAGGESLLGFGPLDGLQLDWRLVRNQTGGSGLLNRSSTRNQGIVFSVENLTGAPQDVRVFYALPFSEQEALEVEIDAQPAPDETDYEGLRGVSVWDLALVRRETREIRVDVSLDWPDGMELRWYP
ncbi:mucoidy inhibitor MuiA family protein [Psychromarinibacter sp. C21-152]|uniref:Mucoidy inhibitor MuiA family protein n=1 Tax=Psychromarinibacter sediminicola TaxID=3033385 RepID=A0AAE3TAQ1_9RHOB|nr:mucoidy inhibitor MuiA family protein [Psychromarinibacter sediminicola]MDF0603472.1 mucoidy inhibitor MuiA family protein [Psychromarinibacter sediminicola]